MKKKAKPLQNYNVLIVDQKTVLAWGLPYDDNEEEGVKIIEDNIADTNRWSVIHQLIVEIKGKAYDTSYSVGATEYQDEQPWQDDDQVEFIEVHPVDRVIKVWERVEKEKSDEVPGA